MRRLLAILALLVATAALLAPVATATDRCPRKSGERLLARSAQATVLAEARDGRQTLTGCARRTGRRRTIATLGRQPDGSRSRLVGLRLAGTRIAYVTITLRTETSAVTAVVADDALYGGRHHELASFADFWTLEKAWTVDAQGDVAWISQGARTAPVLSVWRPGLGVRQVDLRAFLRDLHLADGVLSWRRDNVRKSVDLAAVPRSACTPRATAGTLDIDVYRTIDGFGDLARVCLRAAGRSVQFNPRSVNSRLVDANGPRLVLNWSTKPSTGSSMLDLATGQTTLIGREGDWTQRRAVLDAVVTDGGSVAWIDDGLWVRDAAGTRKVAEAGTAAGVLLRDGSTVTWSGGGPTVTLNP